MEIKVGRIYIQRGGIGTLNDKPNLAIVIPRYHQSEQIINIEMIITQKEHLIRKKGDPPIGVFHHRLSKPTFFDIFKCGNIINPKYKSLLKEFLEGLANV